jgi:FlaG/FlaF family flagellin (archaellin)
MVAITVVLASVLYVWVMNLAETGDKVEQFPTLIVGLYDGGSDGNDTLVIKHVSGGPIDWTNYKILMEQTTNVSNQAMIIDIEGQLLVSESMTITEANAPGFNAVDYEKNTYYNMEIYNIEETKIVWQRKNILCEPISKMKYM